MERRGAADERLRRPTSTFAASTAPGGVHPRGAPACAAPVRPSSRTRPPTTSATAAAPLPDLHRHRLTSCGAPNFGRFFGERVVKDLPPHRRRRLAARLASRPRHPRHPSCSGRNFNHHPPFFHPSTPPNPSSSTVAAPPDPPSPSPPSGGRQRPPRRTQVGRVPFLGVTLFVCVSLS